MPNPAALLGKFYTSASDINPERIEETAAALLFRSESFLRPFCTTMYKIVRQSKHGEQNKWPKTHKISLSRVNIVAPWPVAIPENSYQHSAPVGIANVIDGQLRHVVSGMNLVSTHYTSPQHFVTKSGDSFDKVIPHAGSVLREKTCNSAASSPACGQPGAHTLSPGT